MWLRQTLEGVNPVSDGCMWQQLMMSAFAWLLPCCGFTGSHVRNIAYARRAIHRHERRICAHAALRNLKGSSAPLNATPPAAHSSTNRAIVMSLEMDQSCACICVESISKELRSRRMRHQRTHAVHTTPASSYACVRHRIHSATCFGNGAVLMRQ